MRRLVAALLATAAVLAASVGAYAALGGADRGPAPRAPGDPSPVRIRGNIEGLYPGQQTTMRVRVLNRTDRRVRVRWIQANVGPAGPECASDWLQTQRIWPRARIPAGAVLRLDLPVALSAAAPDACQNATFPLRYRARVWTPRAGA